MSTAKGWSRTPTTKSGVRRAGLLLYRATLLVVAGGVVLQTFLAGTAIFGTGEFETHRSVGWSVHTAGMVAVVAAIVGPRTREAVGGAIGLVVLNTAQIVLSGSATAAIAALHPTLALGVLALAVALLIRSGTRRR